MRLIFFLSFFCSTLLITAAHSYDKKHQKRLQKFHQKVKSESTLKENQLEQLYIIFERLRSTTHQILNKNHISMNFYNINNPDYFMESNFYFFQRLVLQKKSYRIGVNPIIFKKKIPKMALVGVMAHELVHTEDFETRNLIEIAKMYFNSSQRTYYERQTDIKVIFKGLDQELIAYKQWQYPLLTKEALKKKKKQYLSLEEVKFIANKIKNTDKKTQEKLLKFWIKNTPLNMEELESSYQKFNSMLE